MKGLFIIVPLAIVAVISAILFAHIMPNAGSAVGVGSPYIHIINATSQGGYDAIGNTHYVVSDHIENNGTLP